MYTYVLETKYQIKRHQLLLVTGLADVVASCNQSCIYFVHGPVADKFAGVRQHACFLFGLSHHFFSTPKKKMKAKTEATTQMMTCTEMVAIKAGAYV